MGSNYSSTIESISMHKCDSGQEVWRGSSRFTHETPMSLRRTDEWLNVCLFRCLSLDSGPGYGTDFYPRSCNARGSEPSDTAMTAAVVRVRRDAVAYA